MVDNTHFGVFIDMGLGKTVCSLLAYCVLKKRGLVNHVLIIAPKAVRASWENEIDKWDFSKDLLLTSYPKKSDFIFINPEKLSATFQTRFPKFIDMVVVDESSKFKNYRAKRTKMLIQCLKNSQVKRVYLLSGTPKENTLIDLWSQMELIYPEGNPLGKNITAFRQKYMTPYFINVNNSDRLIYKTKVGALDELAEQVSDRTIHYKSEDYLDLPEVVEYNKMITPPDSLIKYMKEVGRSKLLEVERKEGQSLIIEIKNVYMIMRILASGFYYHHDLEENKTVKSVKEISNHKLDVLELLVESIDSPVIVAFNFIHERKMIQRRFKEAVHLNSSSKSKETIAKWNRGEIPILLANPVSVGYGLNLQDGGNHIVIYSPINRMGAYSQMIKRLHRSGQKNKVYVHRFCTSGTIESKIYHELDGKVKTSQELLSMLVEFIEGE